MKAPSAVRISGREWPVKYRPQAAMKDCLGRCVYDSGQIEVRTHLKPFDKRDTVLHEVFHAILHPHGLTPEAEEVVVNALATGLVGVLQDNPKFAQWLIEPFPSTPT